MFPKSPPKLPGSDSCLCKFHLLSSCTKGRECPFLHSIPKELSRLSSTIRKEPCYFFLKKGLCNDGYLCPRSHDEPPSFNGTIKKRCIYFSQGQCIRENLCSYMHDLPLNHSLVNITDDSVSYQLGQFEPIAPIVINTSDDVPSMVMTPKLCHFSRRGMCFFGDGCINFHDKPVRDDDDDTFISDLRKNEASNEKNETHTPDSSRTNSNKSVMLTKNEEINNSSLSLSSNSDNQCISSKIAYSSSKSKEFPNGSSKPTDLPCKTSSNISSNANEFGQVSYSSFEKCNKINNDLCSSFKPKEIAKNPSISSNSKDLAIDSCEFSNSKEFVNSSSKPKEFSKDTFNFVKSKGLERDTYTKSKGSAKDTYSYTKSKGFARDTYFLNSKNFITGPRNLPKFDKFSRSKFTCNSQSKEFSNVPDSFTKTGEFFNAPVSRSKTKGLSKFRYSDNLTSKELPGNAYVLFKSKKFNRNSDFDPKHFRNAGDSFMIQEHSRNTDISLKSKEQFEVQDLTLVETKESCNTKHGSADSRKQYDAPRKSKSKTQFRVVTNSSYKLEESKNADNSAKSKATDLISRKTVHHTVINVPFNSKEQSNAIDDSKSKTEFSLSDCSDNQTKRRMTRNMTRKQSKSQRKLKSGNKQPLVVFQEITHSTKKV